MWGLERGEGVYSIGSVFSGTYGIRFRQKFVVWIVVSYKGHVDFCHSVYMHQCGIHQTCHVHCTTQVHTL